MKRTTPTDLQAARRDAAERFQAIGLLMLKEAGVNSWEFHEKGLRGRAYPKRCHVICPKPTTRRRLYILAHECAHIACNHIGGKPSHRKEYEAEIYAEAALRRHGVPVPRKESERAKQYVAYRIDQAIRMGKAKKLDRTAVKWCEMYHRPATKRALANRSVELLDLSGPKKEQKPTPPPQPKAARPKTEITLTQHLRAAAKSSGLSVNQIAHTTGIDQSGLNRFLNGTRSNIRIDVADKLLRLFKLIVVRQDRPLSD